MPNMNTWPQNGGRYSCPTTSSMLAASRADARRRLDEVLVVENAVVLVRDLLVDDVLILGGDIIIRFSSVLCRLPA